MEGKQSAKEEKLFVMERQGNLKIGGVRIEFTGPMSRWYKKSVGGTMGQNYIIQPGGWAPRREVTDIQAQAGIQSSDSLTKKVRIHRNKKHYGESLARTSRLGRERSSTASNFALLRAFFKEAKEERGERKGSGSRET